MNWTLLGDLIGCSVAHCHQQQPSHFVCVSLEMSFCKLAVAVLWLGWPYIKSQRRYHTHGGRHENKLVDGESRETKKLLGIVYKCWGFDNCKLPHQIIKLPR